ncbi:uncharacterized protein DNG_04529 [Cephalotrichum gorgonifer]|uniref:Heterokaryon incompatibility domain-containing protein n=1 Tax=Cephalotrichum gorgonifer TaxID=2041049 RepID=A0AAE8MWA9_9PEZI|nr:uncharacterized protein DNG_04529 [Cephalotrichum gorgonifer]
MAETASSTEPGPEQCDVCFSLRYSRKRDNQLLNLPAHMPYGQNWVTRHINEFEASSARGCHVCDFIVNVMQHFEIVPEARKSISVAINGHGQAVVLLSWSYTTIQVYTPSGYPPAWEGLVNSNELSLHADSSEAYTFIETCLAKCNQHLKCRPLPSQPPARLIDVGSLSDTKVRLIDNIPTTQSPYIALSYCWGKAKVVKTTQANYQAMKRGIQISTLPLTI